MVPHSVQPLMMCIFNFCHSGECKIAIPYDMILYFPDTGVHMFIGELCILLCELSVQFF